MSGDLTQDQGKGRGRQQGETPSLKGITAGADIFRDGKALPMEEVREKLKNLEQHLPDQHESVYEFGRLLAGRLNSQLVPAGFNLAAELLLHDLQAGVDGFSGKPIGSNLAGQPAMVYSTLRMSIPDIAAAVSPKGFAEGVGQVVSEVNAKIKEDHD